MPLGDCIGKRSRTLLSQQTVDCFVVYPRVLRINRHAKTFQANGLLSGCARNLNEYGAETGRKEKRSCNNK